MDGTPEFSAESWLGLSFLSHLIAVRELGQLYGDPPALPC
jgi:hypothetical protein